MNNRLLIAALALGVFAALIGVVARAPDAAALFALMWSFALAFIDWRRAWLWPLILIAWLPLSIATGLFPQQVGGWRGCPRGPINPWEIALIVAAGSYVFAAAGAVTSVVISYVLSIGPWRDARWTRYVKPILDWGGSALAAGLVLLAALSIVQPLHPYDVGERYCWDEYCFRVTHVERVKTIGTGPDQVRANGTFYVVTAQMEAPWWGRFDWSADSVYVISAGARAHRRRGRVAQPHQFKYFEHSATGQRAQDLLTGKSSSCHQIPGASETETIVFDLPDDVVQPRLIVRDTEGFEGFLGGMRLGLHYIKPAFNLRYD